MQIMRANFVAQQLGKKPGDACHAEVSIQNTGDVVFTAYLGFSIQPNNYTDIGWIDSPYVNVGVINPGETKTFITNDAVVPGDAAEGPMDGWVTLKYYDDSIGDHVMIDEIVNPNAYAVVIAPLANIVSMSWY